MVRTGIYFASVPAVGGVVCLWAGWWGAGVAALGLAAFVLYFFRDPERAVNEARGAIVSPADGRVLSVDVVELDQKRLTRITIFLSLFDVHVNRSPIAGTITSVEYRPGKFHPAHGDPASRENEQNEVVVEGEGTRVVFRQIAGILARRIEFWKKQGDTLTRGERVGMIRFGSRVEVFLEAHYRVHVKPGQHAEGGTTVLAVRP